MKQILLLLILFASYFSSAQQVCPTDTAYPFTTDSVHLKIWNKSEYIPFFVKGCNLGIAVPGTFPGELAATRTQYSNWFSLIKEAGFNSIRLYTLHFPRFYEVLDSFNLANSSNPLYFFQGVWLEEELPNYNQDLYFLDSAFKKEIEDNVNCVHGNATIPQRFGKAYGSYTANVSKWNMGYIIGRETFPEEVIKTNLDHANDTVYNGIRFSVQGKAAEVFVTKKLDYLVEFEHNNYNTQRPVSYSSWPTLDPITHPTELYRYEDTASIDLSLVDYHLAPAGCFASFHAYPYYPDFVSDDPGYQTFFDSYGPNSYLGYLTDLKNHYHNMPLIIAETGVPSSWGIAHYSTSGMHHGGANQKQQGQTMIRLLHNVKDANCAGAMDFAFIDEWFKSTWITAPLDYDINRRVFWHNVMSPEQNYGLIGFKKNNVLQNWASYPPNQAIANMKAAADYDYFNLDIALGERILNPDDIWIAFDTYRADLGESILPSGDTVQNRAEFALHINNYSAELYVTQAYDIFGIWANNSPPAQLYHSVASDGAPWQIERWKTNNAVSLLVYVGNLKVRNQYLPAASDDAVTIYDDSLKIRIPWTLLHFTDPSTMTVFNDKRATPAPEDTISDGIQVTAFYHNQKFAAPNRFTWASWNDANDAVEYKKDSYYIVKSGLSSFNNPALPISDNYLGVDSFPFAVAANNGLLKNDFDMDGSNFQSLLIGNAQHGNVILNFDGSFSYTANAGYVGQDYFEYCLFDGLSLSKTAFVCLDVDNSIGIKDLNQRVVEVTIFPNPAKDILNLRCLNELSNISLFSGEGKWIKNFEQRGRELSLDVSELNNGIYFLKSSLGGKIAVNRFNISK